MASSPTPSEVSSSSTASVDTDISQPPTSRYPFHTSSNNVLTLHDAFADSPNFRANLQHFEEQVDALEKWFDGIIRWVKVYTGEVKRMNTQAAELAKKCIPTALDDILLDSDFVVPMLQSMNEALQAQNSMRNHLDHRRSHKNAHHAYETQLNRYMSQSKAKEPSALREDAFQLYTARKDWIRAGAELLVWTNKLKIGAATLIANVCVNGGRLGMSMCENDQNAWSPIQKVIDGWEAWSQDVTTTGNNYLSRFTTTLLLHEHNYLNTIRPPRDLTTYSSANASSNSVLMGATAAAAAIGSPLVRPRSRRSTMEIGTAANPSSATLDSPSNQPTLSKQGYLQHRGSGRNPSWTRRYFFLHSGEFGYVNVSTGTIHSFTGESLLKGGAAMLNQKDVKQAPRTSCVVLGEKVGILLCEIRTNLDVDRRYCFEVVCAKKTSFVLQAETEEEYLTWIDTFAEAKKYIVEHGSGLLPQDVTSQLPGLSPKVTADPPKKERKTRSRSSSFARSDSPSTSSLAALLMKEGSKQAQVALANAVKQADANGQTVWGIPWGSMPGMNLLIGNAGIDQGTEATTSEASTAPKGLPTSSSLPNFFPASEADAVKTRYRSGSLSNSASLNATLRQRSGSNPIASASSSHPQVITMAAFANGSGKVMIDIAAAVVIQGVNITIGEGALNAVVDAVAGDEDTTSYCFGLTRMTHVVPKYTAEHQFHNVNLRRVFGEVGLNELVLESWHCGWDIPKDANPVQEEVVKDEDGKDQVVKREVMTGIVPGRMYLTQESLWFHGCIGVGGLVCFHLQHSDIELVHAEESEEGGRQEILLETAGKQYIIVLYNGSAAEEAKKIETVWTEARDLEDELAEQGVSAQNVLEKADQPLLDLAHLYDTVHCLEDVEVPALSVESTAPNGEAESNVIEGTEAVDAEKSDMDIVPPSIAPSQPVECHCEDHLDRQEAQIELPISAKKAFHIMFQDSTECDGGFWKKINELKGNWNSQLSQWSAGSPSSRTLTFIMPVNNSMVKLKETEVAETQSIQRDDEHLCYNVLVETKTAQMPYSDAFLPLLKYCITYKTPTSCTLTCYVGIKWFKSPMVKGIIQKAAYAGLNTTVETVISHLKTLTAGQSTGTKSTKVRADRKSFANGDLEQKRRKSRKALESGATGKRAIDLTATVFNLKDLPTILSNLSTRSWCVVGLIVLWLMLGASSLRRLTNAPWQPGSTLVPHRGSVYLKDVERFMTTSAAQNTSYASYHLYQSVSSDAPSQSNLYIFQNPKLHVKHFELLELRHRVASLRYDIMVLFNIVNRVDGRLSRQAYLNWLMDGNEKCNLKRKRKTSSINGEDDKHLQVTNACSVIQSDLKKVQAGH